MDKKTEKNEFYECHSHIILSGEKYRENLKLHSGGVVKGIIRDRLKTYSEAGVVFLRDGGDKYGVGLYARDIAREYGITFRCPAFGICRAGHYGRDFAREFKDFSEFKELVRLVKKNNGDFIKLFATGIMDFTEPGKVTSENIPLEELKTMVEYCHDEGFSVMIHASGASGVRNALLSRADSLEHGYYIQEEELLLLKEQNTIWVPTLSPVYNLINTGLYDAGILSHILAEHMEKIRRALSLGCLVAPGSDAGSGFVFPDTAAVNEHALLRDAGMDEDALNLGIKAISGRF